MLLAFARRGSAQRLLPAAMAATGSLRLKVHKIGVADFQSASGGLRNLGRRFLTDAGASTTNNFLAPLGVGSQGKSFAPCYNS